MIYNPLDKFYKSIIPFKAVEKLYNKYLEHNLQKIKNP